MYEESELCTKCVREYVYIVPCFRRAKDSDYFLATYRISHFTTILNFISQFLKN